jgi:hypothetical protein
VAKRRSGSGRNHRRRATRRPSAPCNRPGASSQRAQRSYVHRESEAGAESTGAGGDCARDALGRQATSPTATKLQCRCALRLILRWSSGSAERRDSTASGRLQGARQPALVLHFKHTKCDGFLECRARQLQSLVLRRRWDGVRRKKRAIGGGAAARAWFAAISSSLSSHSRCRSSRSRASASSRCSDRSARGHPPRIGRGARVDLRRPATVRSRFARARRSSGGRAGRACAPPRRAAARAHRPPRAAHR